MTCNHQFVQTWNMNKYPVLWCSKCDLEKLEDRVKKLEELKQQYQGFLVGQRNVNNTKSRLYKILSERLTKIEELLKEQAK